MHPHEQVPEAVDDGFSRVERHALHDVGVVAEEGVGAGVDHGLGEGARAGEGVFAVLLAAVITHEDRIDVALFAEGTHGADEGLAIGRGDVGAGRVPGEDALVPDVGDGEESQAKPAARDDGGLESLFERGARARVEDFHAIEVLERLEHGRFPVIPGVVVRRGDDVDPGVREDVGRGGGAIKDEVVLGGDGLVPLITDGTLQVDEPHVGRAEEVSHRGKQGAIRLAEEDLADEAAKTHVAGSKEGDEGGGFRRRCVARVGLASLRGRGDGRRVRRRGRGIRGIRAIIPTRGDRDDEREGEGSGDANRGHREDLLGVARGGR